MVLSTKSWRIIASSSASVYDVNAICTQQLLYFVVSEVLIELVQLGVGQELLGELVEVVATISAHQYALYLGNVMIDTS